MQKNVKNIAGQTGILPPKVVLLIETDPKKSFNPKKPNMKKHLLLLLTLVCVCLASSCKDEDEAAPDSVYMYSTTGTVDAAAGTHSVTIFTTCAWTASADTWITVDPVAGGEKGIHVVKLGYTANPSAGPRTGTVTFKAGAYTETFTLTQKQ